MHINIYLYITYIYIYIYICIYVFIYYIYYTYTYIKELCQKIFIYNEEALCTSHTSCAQVVTSLLLDTSTLCVKYMWYIFSLVCSVFVIQ